MPLNLLRAKTDSDVVVVIVVVVVIGLVAPCGVYAVGYWKKFEFQYEF